MLACALWSAPAAAQTPADDLVGRTIVAIRFTVEGRPGTTPELLTQLTAQLDVKPRTPLTRDALRNSVVHIFGLRRYDDVEVSVAPVAGGVELVFDLTPIHVVDSLAFNGNLGLPKDTLERLIKQRFRGWPQRAQKDVVAVYVRTLLLGEGFLNPTVNTSVDVRHDPDRATLKLDVDAGQRALIGNVDVRMTGESPISASEVISRTGTDKGRPYSPAAIDAALEGIADDLRGRGYYGATAEALPPTRSLDAATVDLEIDVTPGPRVSVMCSAGLPPGGDCDFWVPVKRERTADEDLLDDAGRHIASELRRLGYWHATAEHTREMKDGVRVVSYRIVRGPLYRVDSPAIEGNASVVTPEVAGSLGVVPGGIFDQAAVDAGVANIRTLYIRMGFSSVQIKRDFEDISAPGASEGRVRVHVTIDEGSRTDVTTVQFSGNAHIGADVLQSHMQLAENKPFVRGTMELDRIGLEEFYATRGFQAAKVTIVPVLAPDQKGAALNVVVVEGQQLFIGRVTIVGNRQISETAIREKLTLVEGQPLSEAQLLENERRLTSELSLSARIDQAPRAMGESRVDLTVVVVEPPATSVSFGGGIELARRLYGLPTGGSIERLEFSPRGSFSVGRRNLFGRNRLVNLGASIGLHPKAPTDDNPDVHGFGFGEYHVIASYRAPGAFGPTTDTALTLSFEQAPRTGFNYIRKGLTFEVTKRFPPFVTTLFRYSLEYTSVSNVNLVDPQDQLNLQRAFARARLSPVSAGVIFDSRNDLVDPSRGLFASVESALATRAVLQSQIGYSRTFAQASGFHQISTSPRVVLAGRAEMGVAWAFKHPDPDTGEIVTFLPLGQRFFAGGSSTVRGFAVDALGAAGVLDENGLSEGGNGLVIFNGEVRLGLTKNIGVAGFVDTGNVFAEVGEIDLAKLRTSVGGGFRYKSPIGPLRLDVGFKLARNIIAGKRERGWDIHFGLGEAF